MSTFGAIPVTKACLAASVPDSLRESMGLRNAHVDGAIGVMLRVDSSTRSKSRVDLGDAKAVQLVSGPSQSANSSFKTQRKSRLHRKSASAHIDVDDHGGSHQEASHRRQALCIYTLDKNSQLSLDTVSATERGQPILIHRFEPDMAGLMPVWIDWSFLLISLVKLTEVFALWKLGSHPLWYWTSAGWCHALVSAILLQTSGSGRDNPMSLPTI